MSVGNNIATLRKSAKLTQEQLAEKCNVSRQAVAKWETGESEPTIERLIMLSDVFHVSIDEIIREKQIKKEITNTLVIDDVEIFGWIRSAMTWISGIMTNGSLNHENENRLQALQSLYYAHMYKFVDSNEKVFDKYLICNTTQEERKKFVRCIEGKKLEDYVTGQIEIDKAFELLIEDLEKRIKIQGQKYEIENNDKNVKIIKEIYSLSRYANAWDLWSEKKQCEIKEKFSEKIDEIELDTFVGRLLKFIGEEALTAMKNEDKKTNSEILKHKNLFEAYIRAHAFPDDDNTDEDVEEDDELDF